MMSSEMLLALSLTCSAVMDEARLNQQSPIQPVSFRENKGFAFSQAQITLKKQTPNQVCFSHTGPLRRS